MTTESLHESQESFVRNAEGFWEKIGKADSKAANKLDSANDKIVADWIRGNSIEDMLLPLTTHESTAVKFAAAAHLVRFDKRPEAITILRKLTECSTGLLAPMAAAVLRAHKL